MAAWNLARQGVDVLLLDAGEKFDKSKSWDHVPPGSGARSKAGERPSASSSTRRSNPTSPPRAALSTSRGSGDTAARPTSGAASSFAGRGRLQVGRTRRVGDPLADLATRTSRPTTTRSSSSSASAGETTIPRPCPAAGSISPRRPALRRAPAPEGRREDGHARGRRAARQHDAAHSRLPGLPLLRQLRRRAATPRRSSAPPITCCPLPSRPASSRCGRTPSRRGCSWTTAVSPAASSTSTARRGRSARCWPRSWSWRRAHGLDPPPAELEVGPTTRTASATAPT